MVSKEFADLDKIWNGIDTDNIQVETYKSLSVLRKQLGLLERAILDRQTVAASFGIKLIGYTLELIEIPYIDSECEDYIEQSHTYLKACEDLLHL